MPALAGITDAALKLGKSKQWVSQVLDINPPYTVLRTSAAVAFAELVKAHGGLARHLDSRQLKVTGIPAAALTELASAAGVTVSDVRSYYAPEPVAVLAMGPVFVEDDLIRFVQDPDHKLARPRVWPAEWALVGRAEIAAMLDVGSTRADTRMKEPGAPAPVARLRAGRAWLESAVREYLAIPRSTSHPRYTVDVDHARRLYEGDGDNPGISIQALAAQLEVPANVLRTRLVAAQVRLRTGDLRNTRVPVTPDEVEAIIEALAVPGATWHSVGVQVGRSPMTIQRIALQREQAGAGTDG